MWPFKKVMTEENTDIIENTIVMARYTKDTWVELFQDATIEDWKESTSPDNISKFISNTIVNYASALKGNVSEIVIATIDQKYLEWLEKYGLTHSQGVLNKYIQRYTKKKNYWDERLLESEMTLTCNMLGMPILMMPPLKTSKTEYYLSAETKNKIQLYLSAVYHNQATYCPGWIIKGNEMIQCVDDVLFVADHYWNSNSNIRIGKYLEQTYEDDELSDQFSTILYVIPFVVKTKVDSATIDLSGLESDGAKTLQAMNKVKYTKTQKIELLEILSSDLSNVIGIGGHSLLPNQAYFQYFSKKQKK